MLAVHFTLSAMESLSLFRAEEDFAHFLDLAAADPTLGPALIGGCLVRSHGHLTAVGRLEVLLRAMERVATAYVRWFNQKYRCPGFKLRDGVDFKVKETLDQLRFTLIYDHSDPVRSGLVARPIDYLWSAQRDYAGLAVTGRWNLALARDVLGDAVFELVAGRRPPLADLTPSTIPVARPTRILGAAAQVFGILPEEALTRKHDWRIAMARRCYVHLGRLEGYSDPQLAEIFGKGRSRTSELGRSPIADEAVIAARTLLRDPELSRRVRAPVPLRPDAL
jgi:hypothetical protein